MEEFYILKVDFEVDGEAEEGWFKEAGDPVEYSTQEEANKEVGKLMSGDQESLRFFWKETLNKPEDWRFLLVQVYKVSKVES